ncbi:MAG: winged helix-turn-helix domain-containing protein [Nitrososphaerales archaeon]
MAEVNALAGPRRSRMEVKIDIMQAIDEGAGRPTHIMYRSNLSWAVMRSFMKVLEDQGLVTSSELEGRKNYALTEKGSRVLATYIKVRKQLESATLLVEIKQGV